MDLIEITGPAALTRFSQLLDRAFTVPPGAHYLEDFPVWAVPDPNPFGVRRFGIQAPEGELAAVAGVRLAEMRLAGRLLPVALLGAVATDARFRGRGLATRGVTHALAHARKNGACAALLWGAEHSLYEKLGFGLCGTQALVELESLVFPIHSRQKLNEGWIPALFPALQARAEGLRLLPRDEVWYAAHRHVAWYWVGPPEAPRAYAAVGRGIDLVDFVHEWGGEAAALHGLLNALRERRPGLTLLGPPQLLAEKGLLSENFRLECLFLANILDPGALGIRVDGVPSTPRTPAEIARGFFGSPFVAEPGPAGTAWIWGLDAV